MFTTYFLRFTLIVAVLTAAVTGLFVIGSRLVRNHAQMLAFVSERDGNEEIYLLDVTYGARYNLTQHYNDDEYPAWSPDGDRLAFQSVREGSSNIFVFDLRTGELTAITTTLETNTIPAWSPNGEYLLYATSAPRGTQLNVTRLADGATRPLAGSRSGDLFAAWSPDGSMVAVSASNAEAERELHVIDTIQGRRVRLTQENQWGTAPDWSPDGEQIAYVSVNGSTHIFVIDLLTRETRQITQVQRWHNHPSWSSDGNDIVYSANVVSNYELFLTNVESGETRRLTHHPSDDIAPAWRPHR